MEETRKNQLFLLEEIVKKNFASKYKGSILGIFWSIIKPLMIMILLTIIFSTIFGSKINNYPVYFLSAKCLYDFFNLATTATLNSLKSNMNILKKTPAPKHIFVLGSIISEFVNFVITLIILIIVMIVTKSPFYFETLPLTILPIISLTLMIIGIGLILSIACVYYTDIQHLWGVFTLMLMYASALFYPMDIIPEPYHQYMLLNPIFWIINQFRNFLIWGTYPNILTLINTILLSAIILILGIIIFKKYENKVIMKF